MSQQSADVKSVETSNSYIYAVRETECCGASVDEFDRCRECREVREEPAKVSDIAPLDAGAMMQG